MTLRNGNGEIFAKGRHTKFVALAWKDERNEVGRLVDDEPAPKQADQSVD